MKIIYATDVHGYFERVRDLLDQTAADVYVIAGDLIDIPFYTMTTAMNYHELQTFFHSLRRKMGQEDMYIEDFVEGFLMQNFFSGLRKKMKREPMIDYSEITDEIRIKAKKYQQYTDRARRVMRQKYRVLENMMSFKPGAKVFCLPGNYDMNLKFTALLRRDLHLHAYDIGNLTLAGYGGADLWTPGVPEKYVIRYKAGLGVDVKDNEMYQFFKAKTPDIIAVHQPAHGIRDRITSYGTSGSPSLRSYCDNHNVMLCLFGHVHNEWGVQEVQGTVYLNPSIFGEVTELSGRVAEGGFFHEIEVEGRNISSILYRKLVEDKICNIAEYVRENSQWKEMVIDTARYRAHKMGKNYDARVEKYSHIPEFELYNEIKNFYRTFQTAETDERLEQLEEVALRFDEKIQQDIAMDVMGSVNMGLSQTGSDIDFVLYVRCVGECDKEFHQCERYQEAMKSIKEIIGNEYDFQIMDCINLNIVEQAIREKDYESEILQRFVAYRAICRPINYRALAPVEDMLNWDTEFRKEVEGSIRSFLQIFINTSQHTRSFEKYEKRLKQLGIRIPEAVRDKVQTYLRVKGMEEQKENI